MPGGSQTGAIELIQGRRIAKGRADRPQPDTRRQPTEFLDTDESAGHLVRCMDFRTGPSVPLLFLLLLSSSTYVVARGWEAQGWVGQDRIPRWSTRRGELDGQ